MHECQVSLLHNSEPEGAGMTTELKMPGRTAMIDDI